MKRNKFTERQIFNILKEGESGALIVPDLCRKQMEIKIWRYGSL